MSNRSASTSELKACVLPAPSLLRRQRLVRKRSQEGMFPLDRAPIKDVSFRPRTFVSGNSCFCDHVVTRPSFCELALAAPLFPVCCVIFNLSASMSCQWLNVSVLVGKLWQEH